VLFYLYTGEGVGGAVAYDDEVLRGLNAVTGDVGQLPCGDGTYESALSLSVFVQRLGRANTGGQSEEILLKEVVAVARLPENDLL